MLVRVWRRLGRKEEQKAAMSVSLIIEEEGGEEGGEERTESESRSGPFPSSNLPWKVGGGVLEGVESMVSGWGGLCDLWLLTVIVVVSIDALLALLLLLCVRQGMEGRLLSFLGGVKSL